VELCSYFPMCLHGKYREKFTFLCHSGEGGGAPYPNYRSRVYLDTLPKQPLLSAWTSFICNAKYKGGYALVTLPRIVTP
jgi:hypothetical protein